MFRLQPTLSRSSLEAFSEGFEKEYLSDAHHRPAAGLGVMISPHQYRSPGENPDLRADRREPWV
jgi:hypothetical protein